MGWGLSGGGATPSNPFHTAGWSTRSAANLLRLVLRERALWARPSAKDALLTSGLDMWLV